MRQYLIHILAAVFGLLALLYAGNWLLSRGLPGPLEARRTRTARLKDQIRAKEEELAAIRKSGKQLELWETQSLPSNAEVARSFYQGWLVELVDHVGLTSPTVDSGDPVNRKDMYHVLSFTVRGRGTLEQWTKFLFEFYRAGHLHQVRSIDISPAPRGGLLDVSLSIEALALAGLKGKSRLNPQPADRLVSDRLEDYQVVVQRNLFGTAGGQAHSEVRLTAVTAIAGRPQAWFSIEGRGEPVRLLEGETLEVGPLKAKVAEIYPSDVLLEIDGEHWLLSIGESLSQASALPPEF